MTIPLKLGETARVQIPVWESDFFTKKSGLGSGNFTMTVWKDGVLDAVTPTVAEIGSTGEYKVEFVPDDLGVWFLEVKSDYDGKVWEEDFPVGKTQHFEAQFEAADRGVNTEFGVWIEVDGEPKLDLTSIGLKLYDNDGTEVKDLGTQAARRLRACTSSPCSRLS